jgi:carotenoid cleavage dioxygenase
MGLNSLAMRDNETGETTYFYPGANSYCQEPVFIPRSKDAPEGDGWVMSMIERRTSNICELAVIDTRDFKVPVAIVRLPFHMKAQVHGNWVEEEVIGKGSLVGETEEVEVSGRGALEPL